MDGLLFPIKKLWQGWKDYPIHNPLDCAMDDLRFLK